jgi:hypothetical protein
VDNRIGREVGKEDHLVFGDAKCLIRPDNLEKFDIKWQGFLWNEAAGGGHLANLSSKVSGVHTLDWNEDAWRGIKGRMLRGCVCCWELTKESRHVV